jgi:hypothetical protein
MPDSTMDMPDEGDSSNQISSGDELPVKIDTLSVDGQRPEIGDHVEVKVEGTVKSIQDDCAYVTLEKANDQPIENPKSAQEPDENDLMAASMAADRAGLAPGGGYGP